MIMNKDNNNNKLILTFGKHKGTSITQVPPSYALWILDNVEFLTPEIKEWIELHQDELHEGTSDALQEEFEKRSMRYDFDADEGDLF